MNKTGLAALPYGRASDMPNLTNPITPDNLLIDRDITPLPVADLNLLAGPIASFND